MNLNIPLPPSSTIETSTEPPRTLWMGDLDPSFDELTIQEIWRHLNKEVSVKLIRAKKNLLIPCSSIVTPETTTVEDKNSDNKININGVSFIDPTTTQLHHAGYCFVEFNNMEDAQFALSLNSLPLPNFPSPTSSGMTNPNGQRTFRLNWASGATLQSSIPTTPEYSLFVGDLSSRTTEADLLRLFQEKYQSVRTVRVMTDPITGASRCFGFVRFGSQTERVCALAEMSNIWFKGRTLRVAYATPRNTNTNVTSITPPQPIATHEPLLLETAKSILSQQQALPIAMETPKTIDLTNTTVFIGGLNLQVTEPHLQHLFQPFGPIITVKIPPGKKCGFVKFLNKIDAQAAIQGMQGFIVAGSPIRLSWGRSSSI